MILAVARWHCRRIIWFNFAGTLLVDSVGVGLAAFGMLNPLFATFILPRRGAASRKATPDLLAPARPGVNYAPSS